MIQKFKPDKIEKGLTGIIVLSHGPMAVGMLDSAAVILGNEVKNSAAFCLEANDDPEKYGETVQNAIESFQNDCLIFVDIIGGTPYNQLLLTSRKKGKIPLAVTGVNLPMVIVASSLRASGMKGDELIETMIEETKAGTINVKKRLEKKVK